MATIPMRVTLTEELHTAVKETAQQRGQTMAFIIREALALYLSRTAGKAVRDVHPELGGARPGAGRPVEG